MFCERISPSLNKFLKALVTTEVSCQILITWGALGKNDLFFVTLYLKHFVVTTSVLGSLILNIKYV